MQSPGWAPRPNAAAALSPAPGPSVAPLGCLTRGVVRAEHCRQPRVAVRASPARAGRVGRRLPRRRSTRSRWRRCGRCAVAPTSVEPLSRHVSQSCGRHTAAVAAACSGSWSASQRSLLAVIAATGTTPMRFAHSAAPAEFRDELGRRGAGASVVPQQRISDDFAGFVQAHHAVLLGAHRDGGYVVEATGVLDGGLQGGPPQLRVHLGAVGMRRRPRPRDLTGVRIAHQHLAGLRGRVDTGDEGHSCEATPNRAMSSATAGKSVLVCENS